MSVKIKYGLLAVLLAFVVEARAQVFNPADPAEPTQPVAPPVSLLLEVVPAEGGTVSGAGKYNVGASATVKASANTGFVFSHWTDASDNVLSNNATYTHTKGPRVETLRAHFVFNPGSPSEPSVPILPPKPQEPEPRYQLHLFATEGGSVSGGGQYEDSTKITVSASALSGHRFVAWVNNDGDTLSLKASFQYITKAAEDTLTALFRFNPSEPSEPSEPTIRPKHYVYVTATDGGTVSGPGVKVMEGTATSVTATVNSGYVFGGWYQGDSLVSVSKTYSFTMPTEDVYLQARFEVYIEPEIPFNPSSPGEPSQPVVSKNSLYLMTVKAKPGDTTECVLYVHAIKPATTLSFQLNFPQGAQVLLDTMFVSEKVPAYRVETQMMNDTTMSVFMSGDTLEVGTTKLLRMKLAVSTDISIGTGKVIAINQVSVGNLQGSTETASTRNSSLDVYKFGDADNSGIIDVIDLAMARDYLYGIRLDSFQPVAVDLNRNGRVDAEDIKLLIQLILDR